MDRSHSRDDTSPGSRLLFWVTGRRSTSLDPFLFSGDCAELCIFYMAASCSYVVTFVDAIWVTLGLRQKHFFTDAEVAWLVAVALLKVTPT